MDDAVFLLVFSVIAGSFTLGGLYLGSQAGRRVTRPQVPPIVWVLEITEGPPEETVSEVVGVFSSEDRAKVARHELLLVDRHRRGWTPHIYEIELDEGPAAENAKQQQAWARVEANAEAEGIERG